MIVYRRNHKFCINNNHIKPEHRISSVINGMYAAIYQEFLGASENPKYEEMTYEQRMAKVNDFAEKWLKKRGFYQ